MNHWAKAQEVAVPLSATQGWTVQQHGHTLAQEGEKERGLFTIFTSSRSFTTSALESICYITYPFHFKLQISYEHLFLALNHTSGHTWPELICAVSSNLCAALCIRWEMHNLITCNYSYIPGGLFDPKAEEITLTLFVYYFQLNSLMQNARVSFRSNHKNELFVSRCSLC